MRLTHLLQGILLILAMLTASMDAQLPRPGPITLDMSKVTISITENTSGQVRITVDNVSSAAFFCEVATRTGDGSSSLSALAGVANDKGPIRSQALMFSMISGAENISAITASGLATAQRFPLMRSSTTSFSVSSVTPASAGQEFIVQAGCTPDAINFAYSLAHVSRMPGETTIIDPSAIVLFPSAGSSSGAGAGTPAQTSALPSPRAASNTLALPEPKPLLVLPSSACVNCMSACPTSMALHGADSALTRCWSDCCPGDELARASHLYGVLAAVNPSVLAGARPSLTAAAVVADALSVRPHAPHVTMASRVRDMVAMAAPQSAPPDEATASATATARRMVAVGQDALAARRMASGQSQTSPPPGVQAAPPASGPAAVQPGADSINASSLTTGAVARAVETMAAALPGLPAAEGMSLPSSGLSLPSAGATTLPSAASGLPSLPTGGASLPSAGGLPSLPSGSAGSPTDVLSAISGALGTAPAPSSPSAPSLTANPISAILGTSAGALPSGLPTLGADMSAAPSAGASLLGSMAPTSPWSGGNLVLPMAVEADDKNGRHMHTMQFDVVGQLIGTINNNTFARPSDSFKYHTNISNTLTDTVCLNGACYASCAATIEKTLTDGYSNAQKLGTGANLQPPDLSKLGPPQLPYYTPEYVQAQGFGKIQSPAEKLLAQSLGLTELPAPTPQLVEAVSPMVKDGVLGGVTGVSGFVTSIGDISACSTSCRVACKADNTGSAGNINTVCTGDSSVISTLACLGSTADQMASAQGDVGTGLLAQAVVLEDLLKTLVPTPYSAPHTHSTFSSSPSSPTAHLFGVNALVASQPTRAQAVAAASHVAEVLSAARAAYDVVVPTEQWLGEHRSTIEAAVTEQRSGSGTHAQKTLLNAVGGLVRTLGADEEIFAPGTRLASVLSVFK